jgi:hypothetical protein
VDGAHHNIGILNQPLLHTCRELTAMKLLNGFMFSQSRWERQDMRRPPPLLLGHNTCGEMYRYCITVYHTYVNVSFVYIKRIVCLKAVLIHMEYECIDL